MSKCPVCEATCYISLLGNIECSNPFCFHYSADLYPTDQSSSAKADTGIEQTDPDKVMFFWSHYHHDCGGLVNACAVYHYNDMTETTKTEILEDGKILLIVPADKNAIIPIFCPICAFPMRTLEDSIAFRSHQTCAHCEMRWSTTKFGKWEEGWRPSLETEGWEDYLIYRKAMSRALIIVR